MGFVKSTHYSDNLKKQQVHLGLLKCTPIFYHPGSRQGEEEKKKKTLKVLLGVFTRSKQSILKYDICPQIMV